jgi:hypothetical protein
MNDARNVRRQRRAGYTTIGHRDRKHGSLHTADSARDVIGLFVAWTCARIVQFSAHASWVADKPYGPG